MRKEAALAFAVHSFFQSPPAKNQNGEERQGERAGRAVLRAWRASHAIGAHFLGQSHHARGACEIKGSAGSKSELFDTMTTNFGGPERIRTADLLIANEALYQLSYGPKPTDDSSNFYL